ncbi:MAG: NAD-dependent epimerase/dehydratase family protein [Phycisphaerales bacterium]|nr:NAD-dependent epimerase/dehydratase family protein [Phycisphaerales bacterium]
MNSKYLPTIMMTGTTGFLGQYVLRDFLLRGRRVVAVLRPPLADALPRLTRMLEQIGIDLAPFVESGQFVPVEGSLPDRLPEPDWGPTEAVLHCAASLQLFSNGNGEPITTNLEGAAALIEWAQAHNIKEFFGVSTAYTCGWNRGVIAEDFHWPRPDFQTDYERSKWQAEILMRDWAEQSGGKLTLFRPSFLVGDSETGYTCQFAGFYQLARLIGVLKQHYSDPGNGKLTHIPLRIPGRPESPQNIVPIDFVARIIDEVIHEPRFHGRIYHLTNPEPPTNDMMKRFYEHYFGLYGGYFADFDEVVGHCTPAESLLWEQFHLLTPRTVHNPLFDCANTREVMAARRIEFPTLDLDRLTKLLDYATACDWGRQTKATPQNI